MEYPIFISVKSTNTLYKITNDHSFTEIKTLGNYYFINEISDDILPMRNYILDLVEAVESEVISEGQFEGKKLKIQEQYKLKEI